MRPSRGVHLLRERPLEALSVGLLGQRQPPHGLQGPHVRYSGVEGCCHPRNETDQLSEQKRGLEAGC